MAGVTVPCFAPSNTPGWEYSSTEARVLRTRLVHCARVLSPRGRAEVMMVLRPCSAADTGTGTEGSAALLRAVSLSTPVIRKRAVGRIVMLPGTEAEGEGEGEGEGGREGGGREIETEREREKTNRSESSESETALLP